jgi:hypothetical protein
MIIYAYRSGEIGFALQSPPVGSVPLARAPHLMAERAVSETAQGEGDGWFIPGVAEAFERNDYANALHLRLDYSCKLNRQIARMRALAEIESSKRIEAKQARRLALASRVAA